MLNEEDVNQFILLSVKLKEEAPDLYEKIHTMLQSPYLKVYMALKIQLLTYANELELTPFTIRGNDDLEKYAAQENGEKIIEALASSSRQRAETSLKVAKEIKDLAYDIEEISKKLTQKESKEATIKVIGRAEELRNRMLEENGGKN